MRKLSHEEIVRRQRTRSRVASIPVTVVLNNIRSLFNVGSIFRTADGAGIEKIWLCGITGAPPQAQISKTALGAEEHLRWEHQRDTLAVIQGLKKQGYQIILLEQTDASIPYEEFVPKFPVCLVLGNEVEGVADGIVPFCDQAVEIDMAGIKNSLNVSVAFGIIAYHLRAHYGSTRFACSPRIPRRTTPCELIQPENVKHFRGGMNQQGVSLVSKKIKEQACPQGIQ